MSGDEKVWSFLPKLLKALRQPILIYPVGVIVLLGTFGNLIPEHFRFLTNAVVLIALVAFLAMEWPKARSSWNREEAGPRPEPEPRPPRPATKPPPATSPRAEYLRQILDESQRVRLGGLDPDAADATGSGRGAMTLADVYVALDTQSSEPEEADEGKSGKGPRERDRPHPLSAIRALATAPRRRMVLLGLPGAGKSTFLRYFALSLAEAALEPKAELKKRLPGYEGQGGLPVLVPLGLLAESLPADAHQTPPGLVVKFLHEQVNQRQGLSGYGPELVRELQERGGVVLFDGLDEVADLHRRPLVRSAVEEFATQFPRCEILVTCRTYSYFASVRGRQGRAGGWQFAAWPTHEIAPLSRRKVNDFIAAWYRQLTQLHKARESRYAALREGLERALHPEDPRRLHEIATNPLQLTVMAIVHTDQGELPDARAAVYEKCVDLLLLRWQGERGLDEGMTTPKNLRDALGVQETQLHTALQEVAYRAHEGRGDAASANDDPGRPAVVTEDLLAGVLWPALGGDASRVKTFLDYCESSNALVMYYGTVRLEGAPEGSEPVKVYAFPHLSFQEYLAGRYLGRKADLARTVKEHARRGDRWRQVILLLTEYLCFRLQESERVELILDRLVPETSPSPPQAADWSDAWLAGEILVLLRRAREGVIVDVDSRVVERLVALLQASALTPPERAAAGRVLGELGDPRPGVGVWSSGPAKDLPRMEWLEVAGGTLRMGSGRDEVFETPRGQEKPFENEIGPEGEPFAVEIGPFQLSAYPVTVCQYRPFVEGGGYRDDRYWTKAGRKWRDEVGREAPAEWDDATWHVANHPVTGVSWHEAVAYCRWLTARLREVELLSSSEVIRLPTESEWEWSARGPGGFRWPWGESWREGCCNSRESGVGRPSAVGSFPGGVSWCGASDLAGNVWEWCQDYWADSYPIGSRGGADRVFRGGAWIDLARYVRAASRGGYPPGVRHEALGFRLARGQGRGAWSGE